MKVLQINTVYKVKSTGRTCYEVAKIMERLGHECYTAYGFGDSEDLNTYKVGSKVEYYLHNIFSRITGLQGYFSYFATKRLINYIKSLNPDIIHLRNLHGNYLNLPVLFKYISKSNIPIVLNLHDCWAFTGKCPYYTEKKCYKWKYECGGCIAKREYPQSYIKDFSKKMYIDKKKWFNSIDNLTVIGVSKWIANEAKESFLKEKSITYIYNWINQDVFKPYDEDILQKYKADKNKFTIIGVSALWVKGSPRYDDFMKLSRIIDDSIQIIMVGKSVEKIEGKNIVHIPYIDSTEELAKLYSSSDVYIHFSIEDTFGKVIAEALACGTPAIVYNSTACPEVIKDGCGYVVEKRNVKEAYERILNIKEKGKGHYSKTCINRVNEEFNYYKNTDKLIKLYGELINANKK